MERRIAFLTFLLLVIGLAEAADTSAQMVGGQVFLQGGAAVPGASVWLMSNGTNDAKTETDAEGRFFFPTIMPGKYFVEVEGMGFEGWLAGPVVLQKLDTLLMALFVAPQGIPPNPILVISSRRPWYEHLQPAGLWPFWERRELYEALGSGRFYTQADLQSWSGQSVTLTLSALSPFLHAEPAPNEPSAFVLRGARGCTPLIFIDGHRISQGTEGSDNAFLLGAPSRGSNMDPDRTPQNRRGLLTPIDQFIHVSQIAGLEIYRGASDIPGEFRLEELGSRCGAVVVWSQRGPTG